MQHRRIKFIILPLFLFTCLSLFAADVTMSVDKGLISLLDRTVLKITFHDTKGDAVEIPPIDGLNIRYQGPQSQSNVQIINGKMTRSVTVVHAYIITPTKVGEYTIGPVQCNYKGGSKTLTTKLKVIKPAEDKEAQEISEMLFSTISSSREKPFVHEPFKLDLYVHIRDGLQIDERFGLRGGMPESGIDGEPEWQIIDQQRKEINGSIFTVHHLQTTIETLTAGTFSFQPQIELNIIVPRQKRRSYGFSDPFFGDIFGRQETRPMVLNCNRLEIDVQPIPKEKRPDSYSGGIGRFDFNAEVSPKKVKAGEPITIKMTIRGEGNLQQITPPPLKENSDLKLYEVRTLPSENANEIRFEQVVIPRSDAIKEIPEISFSYFNTQIANYQTIRKGPFPIEVKARASSQSPKVIATIQNRPEAKETKILGQDIIYIKSRPKQWITHPPLQLPRTKVMIPLLSIPIFLLALLTIGTSRRDKLSENSALARRQKAPKAARKSIQKAEKALQDKNSHTFYEALGETLANYFGNRLNLAPGEVSLNTVLYYFPKQYDHEIQELKLLFDTIDQRRYGIGIESKNEDEEMKKMLRSMIETMKLCERIKL